MKSIENSVFLCVNHPLSLEKLLTLLSILLAVEDEGGFLRAPPDGEAGAEPTVATPPFPLSLPPPPLLLPPPPWLSKRPKVLPLFNLSILKAYFPNSSAFELHWGTLTSHKYTTLFEQRLALLNAAAWYFNPLVFFLFESADNHDYIWWWNFMMALLMLDSLLWWLTNLLLHQIFFDRNYHLWHFVVIQDKKVPLPRETKVAI